MNKREEWLTGCPQCGMNECDCADDWVSLTDAELGVIYEQHHNQYGECESPDFGYERAIEAKLKEKNA